MPMLLRLFILAGFFAAGLMAPAAAGEVRWIDPWAPHDAVPELAGGPSVHAPYPQSDNGNAIVWIDPWAGEDCECAGGNADMTGSLHLAGFNGGVGNRQSIVVISNGFFFNPALPAGQVPMTGTRAAPVHPLGGPRF
jgi:hypothetical protein